MSYKLVVFDLDGTLLQDDKTISNNTINYINKLKSNNIEVIIATGRSYYHGKKLIEPLKQDMIIVSNNGSIARHTSNDEVIFANYLKDEKAKVVIKEALKEDLHPIIHTNQFDKGYDLIVERDVKDPKYHGYMSKQDVRYKKTNLISNELTNVLSVCFPGDYNKLETFREGIIKKFPKDYSSFTSKNLKIRGLLEFLDIKGCKWEGVKYYANSKEIQAEEIISIGDDNNDIELIKNSGIGISMKNGTKEIKKVADIITKQDNNNDGAIIALEKILQIRVEENYA